MTRNQECRERLKQVRSEYGYSIFGNEVRGLMRERLDGGVTRPKRKPLSPSKRNALYAKQAGKCAICEDPYPIGQMTDDHLDPNAGAHYNDFRNRRLVCGSCNSRKNANSVYDEAKRLGIPVADLIAGQNTLHDGLSKG